MTATGPHTPSAPPAPAPGAAAQLDDLREADLHEVSGFIHREAAGRAATADEHAALTTRMRWLMLDNPARLADVPLGWVLRDKGAPEGSQIVGAMVCIPQRFACQGKVFTALMSAKWYVAEAHRGGGVGIFMRYMLFARRHALFATTAAPQSAALWKKFGGYEINDQNHELIGVSRFGAVVEEAAFRKSRQPSVARAAGALAMAFPGSGALRAAKRASAGSTLDPLTTPAQAADLTRHGAIEVLSAVRDETFIGWRHFACPDAADHRLFAFTGPSGTSALVITQVSGRGHRHQIRALQVIDLWGDLAASDMPALAGALARRQAGTFDMLVFRAQPDERQRALEVLGFRRRAFEAPIGWCIDKANLLPTRTWYLVPADAE